MMTFTFITALFLPGTYVASLFSSSMFNWQAGGTGSEKTLSSKFWVYWAVAAPLTAAVMFGWYLTFALRIGPGARRLVSQPQVCDMYSINRDRDRHEILEIMMDVTYSSNLEADIEH